MYFILLLLCIFNSAIAAPLASNDRLYDELEGLDLATALLRDGKLEASKTVLSGLSRSERDKRAAEILKVEGDLAMAQANPNEALSFYRRGLAAKTNATINESLQLSIARAQQRLANTKECAEAATQAGALVFRQEADILLKANCERSSHKLEEAWGTLSRGMTALGGFSIFLEQQRLLQELGLRNEALARALQFIVGSKAIASQALALAETMAEKGAKEEALYVLEVAQLRFPSDTDLLLALAPLYYAKGLKRSTADSFAQVALHNATYAEHASETLRQLGAKQLSRYYNIFIPGEKERGRQKLALAVENSRWDLVGAMDTFIRRSSLTDDDEVNYALAYSLLRGGDLERAREYLGKIKAVRLLEKVSVLYKNLEKCVTAGWSCL